ncbi:hypothetical protein EJ08DRAFT_696552 [Tothia fuscella]|uniref:2EXR domain-containing protein n=1 Tax=Tothia fuscella TaxID=1048955 RepID=A0A9P4TYI5_9PEZI|nr:hypothetical protein EJ08DRAFT_696552 [Tothia fuscella]
MLYGKNGFIIDCEDIATCNTIQGLTPQSLASIRALRIILNAHTRRHSKQQYGKELTWQLRELGHLVDTFAKTLTPFEVRLTIELELRGVVQLERVMTTLTQLPPLAALHIIVQNNRTGRHPAQQSHVDEFFGAHELLEQFGRQLVKSPPRVPTTFHQFPQLPAELQQMILSYAISPLRLLHSFHETTRLRPYPGVDEETCCGNCGPDEIENTCFCRSEKVYSSECFCHQSSSGLLGVSKDIRLQTLKLQQGLHFRGGLEDVAYRLRNVICHKEPSCKDLILELGIDLTGSLDYEAGWWDKFCNIIKVIDSKEHLRTMNISIFWFGTYIWPR